MTIDDRRIDVKEWVGDDEWNSATPWIKERYVQYCADRLLDAKRKQIQSAVGADGRQLLRVFPWSRPDHTTDDPLFPHGDMSRSLRLLRTIADAKRGVVTFNWHYWTRILGFHADGIPSRFGPRVRDIFGTPGRFLRPVKYECVKEWRRLKPVRTYRAEPERRPNRPVTPGPIRLPRKVSASPSSRPFTQ